MTQVIKPINSVGAICYLVENNGSYILIDTGLSTQRANLYTELENTGCKPGNVKLVLLTHGDIDHAGNCAYIREKFGVKIAMHFDDAGMVERKDMTWNRKNKPDRISILGRIIMLISKAMGGSDKPALLISIGVKPKEKQNGIARFESMVKHGDQFNLLGHIYFNSQTPPCLKCGAGSYCCVGGLWKYVLDQDENKLKEFEFTPDKFKKWEDCPQIVEEVYRCGKILEELQVCF